MTTSPAAPQFGIPEPGLPYRDRPAAFGVADRDGEIALVRITLPGRPPYFDLPGGAIEPGESEPEAMVREFGEETGLIVRAGTVLTRADQYFRLGDGSPVNNRSVIFHAQLAGEDPGLKIEDDHELVWVDPAAVIAQIRHDSHAWALTCWLRARSA